MKFCMPHWDRLKQAIEDRGLTKLVHSSGEAVVDSMVREVEGNATPGDFDPLANATWAIYGAYIRDVGLAAMMVSEDGKEVCPLCGVKSARDDMDDNWINGSADQQLDHARSLGLMPQPS